MPQQPEATDAPAVRSPADFGLRLSVRLLGFALALMAVSLVAILRIQPPFDWARWQWRWMPSWVWSVVDSSPFYGPILFWVGLMWLAKGRIRARETSAAVLLGVLTVPVLLLAYIDHYMG